MFVRWFDSASGDGDDDDVDDEEGVVVLPCLCACSPTLLLTLLATAASTALLVAAVVTDHWEHVAWDRERLQHAQRAQHADSTTGTQWALEWLLDGQVAKLLRRRPRQSDAGKAAVSTFFLMPMNGGIWTLCATLNEEEQALLRRVGFTQPRCVNYLSTSRVPDGRPSWQRRMQNLSISCALVCLIILGSSAMVGAFGVLAHQTSAVLVTGVLYFLAATFALFTLTIIHFKRAQSPSLLLARARSATSRPALADGVLPGEDDGAGAGLTAPLWAALLEARRVETAWSLQLGWGGVLAAVFTAALWIALSKAMRGAAAAAGPT